MKPGTKPLARRTPLKAHKPMSRGSVLLKARKPMKAVGAKRKKKAAPVSVEQAHKAAVAALGCAVCWRLHGPHDPGPVELHHLRGDGWGKGDYTTLIPLCVEHHRGDTGVHGLGVKGFPKHYGFDQHDLLAWTLGMIEHSSKKTIN
jgi:hypothetical protein